MNKLSNINWAALLLGGVWGTYNNVKLWSGLWVIAGTAILLGAWIGSVSIILSSYVILAALSVYLALQGNHLVSKEIRKKELSAEAEQEERIAASARQRKLLIYGIFFRPITYYFTLGFIPIMLMTPRYSTMPDYGISPWHILFALLAIDALALVITLLFALGRHVSENELYSGKVDTDLIVATPMKCQAVSKQKASLSTQAGQCSPVDSEIK